MPFSETVHIVTLVAVCNISNVCNVCDLCDVCNACNGEGNQEKACKLAVELPFFTSCSLKNDRFAGSVGVQNKSEETQ